MYPAVPPEGVTVALPFEPVQDAVLDVTELVIAAGWVIVTTVVFVPGVESVTVQE